MEYIPGVLIIALSLPFFITAIAGLARMPLEMNELLMAHLFTCGMLLVGIGFLVIGMEAPLLQVRGFLLVGAVAVIGGLTVLLVTHRITEGWKK